MNSPGTASTPYLKQPFAFDVARLQDDLRRVGPSEWISHLNTSAYETGWSCVPLRSIEGRTDHIMPVEGGRFGDTPILARCPHLRHAIDQFQCENTSIRLMGLEAGAVIHEQRDAGGTLEDGLTRLHIPAQTSPLVTYRIEGEEIHFSAGDAWYLNASCLHGAHNRSTQARIHLMIDCVTNPWLTQLFRDAGGVLRESPPYGDPSIHDGNVLQVIAALRSWPADCRDRLVCSTPWSALDELPDSVPPAAFVLHVSRCRSTLITQALASLPQCIAMSESPVLDAFFRLHHRHPEQSGRASTLQRLVAAPGQRRSAAERHLVIKFDCRHLPWMPFVQAAFPGTPTVFLYREPGEVLASQCRQRGL